MTNKVQIAAEHFDSFERLQGVNKEDFIQNYPLSCFPYVTPRKFWSVCKELHIVSCEFYDGTVVYNELEYKLRFILDEYRFSEEYGNPEFQQEVLQQIQTLFATHKILQ